MKTASVLDFFEDAFFPVRSLSPFGFLGSKAKNLPPHQRGKQA